MLIKVVVIADGSSGAAVVVVVLRWGGPLSGTTLCGSPRASGPAGAWDAGSLQTQLAGPFYLRGLRPTAESRTGGRLLS